jgi:tetratricopeptide (TPR) repeat protein
VHRVISALAFSRRLLLLLLFSLTLNASAWPLQAAPDTHAAEAVATGSIAMQNGDYAAAERSFRIALKSTPDSVPLLNNIAICVGRQHREDEAITLYQRALTLKPGDSITQRNLGVAYFRAAQYKAALPLLKAFADTTPGFQSLSLTGLDLFALDRFDEAAGYLEKAHKLQPNDLQTLDMLGKAYLRVKNYSGVTNVFQQIMTINPNSAAAHVMMAMADDNLYREDDAIREFEAAAKADPKYPGIHAGLGTIYFRNDNIDAADREVRQELALYPTDPIANCTLGRILRRRNQPADAIHFLEAALSVNPVYFDALMELGECDILLHQPDAAVSALQKAVSVQPQNADAHYVLGTALSKSGHLTQGARERSICAQLRNKEHQSPATKMQ